MIQNNYKLATDNYMESIDISDLEKTEKKPSCTSAENNEPPEQTTSLAIISTGQPEGSVLPPSPELSSKEPQALPAEINSDGSRNSKPVVNWPDKNIQKKTNETQAKKQEEGANYDEGKVEEVFQDVFHLFERGEKLVLDGKVLAATMEGYEIHMTDTEIDSILSILDNYGHMMDIHEFCYLVIRAKDHILKTKKSIKSKTVLSALRKFLVKSATACISKRDIFSRTSADTLKFYFDSVRLTGITENQVAQRACSIDTTGHSPYKESLVLPGLPPDKSGKCKIVSKTPCTIIPPRPSAVGGKRLSRCTILPYTAAGLEGIETKVLHAQHRNSKCKPSKVDTLPKLGTSSQQTKQRKKSSRSRGRGRPLPFKLPQIAKYDGREIHFEETTMIRDEIMLAQRDYHKKERVKAAKKILRSIPSERLKYTIKAYFD